MGNDFFASIFTDHKGYNVAIFEVDRPKLLLHESHSSDSLSIRSIASVVKPYTGNKFMGCYFNFIEKDTSNLIPNGVIELIGGSKVLIKVNENLFVPLQSLGVQLGEGELIIKQQLSGRILSEFRGTNPARPDEISHQISNLIQVADNWNMFIGKSNIEIRTERKGSIDFSGYQLGRSGW